MIARTSYADIPGRLVEELAAAGLDPLDVFEMVVSAFEEDLPNGARDVTSSAMPPMGVGVGDVGAREAGVVAGLGVAELVFAYAMGSEVDVTDRLPDGSQVAPGDVVMTVSGPVQDLLTAERTALNFASHLSGVATATSHWVAAL